MTDKEFIEKAREQYARDGEIEIDDEAKVSYSPLYTGSQWQQPGAYVQAWVWVSSDEEGEDGNDD
jgi:hypothetical protein